jgi:transposase
MTNPESITQFLTLLTITTRTNPQRRTTNPLVDFTKSVMFTSDVYLDVVQQLHERRMQVAKDKERSKTKKAESKCKRLLEWEEERRRREAQALEVAGARAAKALQRQEAVWAKALERAESKRKKAERAFIGAQQQLMCANRALDRLLWQDLASLLAKMVVG